ncbi:MAG: type IV secretion system DNA-binding domain-containing protein [Acidobacteriota bacterium]|jgi:type IV secretory pathway TraG/TraD family ATPase VirD4|nr:type IV secretion system DNA-binding domain-containing protein [Acidobacteriota bacterium]
MSSHAYIAHDRIVTISRMYIQMAAVGLVIAVLVYAGAMSAFFSRRLAEPVPEYVSGQTVIRADSPRLRARSILKYYVSLNPRNYLRLGFDKKEFVPTEAVEPELRGLLRNDEVPRELYKQAILVVTHDRVEELRWMLPASLLFFPVFGVGYFFLFSWINRLTEKTEFVRGSDLMPFHRLKAELDSAINKEHAKAPLRLGEVDLPDSVSRRHILVLGTSGTGKSACLNQHIASLRKHGKSIIYDVKGEFCAKHLTDRDTIFYPFDKRSAPWSFFNEVKDYPDLDILCTSLYEPPKDSKDAYWYNAARDVFRTGLFYLMREEKTANRDIWEFFSQSLENIRNALYTLPAREIGALKHIDKSDSNQAASVISILQERLTFFRYLCDSDGTFSFRDFIRDEKRRGNLFLMNIRRYDAIFRPLMTFVIDIMIREVLSLSDSFTRRVTFVVDEFGSLAKLPGIFDFLTMGRSKGGFLVLANQDLGSVSNVYGHDQKETFFNNFNIHLVFRLNDPTTAEFLSKAAGEREVVKKFRSSQFSPNDLGDRFSLGEQEKLEKVILPTEFQNLPDFHTYLKIANYGIARMETRKRFLPSVAEEFLQRDFKLDTMLHEP